MEVILRKIGLILKEVIIILKMIRLGYFLFTINPNSELNKIRNRMRYSIIAITCVYLPVVMIYLYVKMHTIEVITIQI